MTRLAKRLSRVMDNTLAYRAWQAPFAERKLAPLFAHGGLAGVRRVLDVGCGPGTNARHFADVDYLGLDVNPAYVDHARRRYGREFLVADVTTFRVDPAERFDFILVNSLLHHIATPDVRDLLRALAGLLTDEGHVHVLDLVLPPPSLARVIALADRGDFPRPLAEWRTLFEESFAPVVFEPYAVGALGAELWRMVYFKGRARP
jgi:SAM-dependent methyltransferase